MGDNFEKMNKPIYTAYTFRVSLSTCTSTNFMFKTQMQSHRKRKKANKILLMCCIPYTHIPLGIE